MVSRLPVVVYSFIEKKLPFRGKHEITWPMSDSSVARFSFF